MKLIGFIYKSCLIGAGIPLVLVLLNQIIILSSIFQEIVVFLWPSSIFMMATEGLDVWLRIQAFLFSTLVNGFYFSLIGLLAWLGIYKIRPILVLIPILMFCVWYNFSHL